MNRWLTLSAAVVAVAVVAFVVIFNLDSDTKPPVEDPQIAEIESSSTEVDTGDPVPVESVTAKNVTTQDSGLVNTDQIADNREKFFQDRQSRIQTDFNGNYLVDVSSGSSSGVDYMISEWPIYYPTQEQLDEGVSGCATGGYFVDYGATYTYISVTNAQTHMFHYICEFDSKREIYISKRTEPSLSMMESVTEVLQQAQDSVE